MLDEAQGASEETTETQSETQGSESQAQKEWASKEDFQSLKSQNELLMQQMQHFMKSLAPKETPVAVTKEEAESLAADPKKIGQFIDQKLSQATQKLTEDQKRSSYDAKAEAEFPALKTDEKFKKEVLAQAQELILSDGLSQSHPMLIYRAAQLAAAKRALTQGNQSGQKGGQSSMVTSADPNGVRPRAQGGASKIDDNDPRIRAAKTLGLDEKQIKKLKENLPPYKPSERRQERILTK